MIDLPQAAVTDLPKLADWVELCVLVREQGIMSHADVAGILKDAGLLGKPGQDLPAGDEAFLDEDNLSNEEAGERLSESLWGILKSRQDLLAGAYPFEIVGDTITRLAASWKDVPGFTLLLIADIARAYASVRVSTEPNAMFGGLFEKVVAASKQGIVRGTCIRFGWPRDADWPAPIKDRIALLGDRLQVLVENLEGKITNDDKDRGLDVTARLSFGDDGPGSMIFLIQCATGKNWRKKHGEPVMAKWEDIFRWDAVLVRAIAVPWRLESKQEYVNNFRHFNKAVILDRLRLAFGRPDLHLGADDRDTIRTWCSTHLNRFPRLRPVGA